MRVASYTEPETLTNEDIAYLLTNEDEMKRVKFGYTDGRNIFLGILREVAWRLTHDEKFKPETKKEYN